MIVHLCQSARPNEHGLSHAESKGTDEQRCNATTGVIVRCAFVELVLRRVKPYQGFSSVMHKYQVEPCSRLV